MVEDPSEGATPPPSSPPAPPSWPPADPPPSWAPPPSPQQWAPPGPPAPPAGWGVPGAPPPGYPGGARTNGLAVASLVLGCVGFIACFVPSILAVVFGHVSKNQIDGSRGAQTGRGLAVAGIVLGWIGVGLALVIAALFVIGLLADGSTSIDTDDGIESLRALASAVGRA